MKRILTITILLLCAAALIAQSRPCDTIRPLIPAAKSMQLMPPPLIGDLQDKKPVMLFYPAEGLWRAVCPNLRYTMAAVPVDRSRVKVCHVVEGHSVYEIQGVERPEMVCVKR